MNKERNDKECPSERTIRYWRATQEKLNRIKNAGYQQLFQLF
jgi:hypothetical protein